MNVAVHGCLDVGVSCDGLYRLDICIERSEKSHAYHVTESVSSR